MAYRLMAACAFASGLISSCSVHEFPSETAERRSVVLNLDFNTDFPLNQIIEYTRAGSRVSDSAGDYDIRYQVRVYKIGNDGQPEAEEYIYTTETKDDVANPDHNINMELEEGRYRFLIWADYVDNGSLNDKFYDTGNFGEITLYGDTYYGNTVFRDAFRGMTDATITPSGIQEITVAMERPLARYQFITTDLDDFLTKVIEESRASGKADDGNGTRAVDLNDYRVIFRYAGFMPSSFNMFTNKPIDAKTGIAFNARISRISDTEAELGFDYVFVNGTESIVPVTVEVYNSDNELISSTDPVDVPLIRSRHTIVRGPFLTSEASGSVGINPGFDGEWNYEIK